jgi:hypothetical protein
MSFLFPFLLLHPCHVLSPCICIRSLPVLWRSIAYGLVLNNLVFNSASHCLTCLASGNQTALQLRLKHLNESRLLFTTCNCLFCLIFLLLCSAHTISCLKHRRDIMQFFNCKSKTVSGRYCENNVFNCTVLLMYKKWSTTIHSEVENCV